MYHYSVHTPLHMHSHSTTHSQPAIQVLCISHVAYPDTPCLHHTHADPAGGPRWTEGLRGVEGDSGPRADPGPGAGL